MMDYEVQRCTKHCAATERQLLPGEEFFSVLMAEGAELKRYDYAAEAWQGPPAEAIGWWKSQVPDPKLRRKQWAPNDVMLEFFDQLADQPERQDMRYVLALLLVRRRVMRLEESQPDEQGQELIVLYCPRRDETYQIPVTPPSAERVEEIQAELAGLLE